MNLTLQSVNEVSCSLVSSWLASEENYQWLEFGNRCAPLTLPTLKMMLCRPMHDLRVFTDPNGKSPAGIVALSDINRDFGTATLWYVLGDKSQAGKGLTRRAVSLMLGIGFDELMLHAIYAWSVATNTASIRILQHNGFELIGTRRECHRIEGQPCDRLLFDLLASEYKGLL